MTLKILLADDHEIVLEGIRTLIEKSKREWEICGEARNGADAVEMVKRTNPHVAVLDITMPGLSGLQAAKQISELGSGCRVLIFTMHDSGRLGIEAQNAGAHGYVLKSQAARDLIRAIDCLLGGKTFFGAAPESTENEKRRNNRGTLLRRAFGFAPA